MTAVWAWLDANTNRPRTIVYTATVAGTSLAVTLLTAAGR